MSHLELATDVLLIIIHELSSDNSALSHLCLTSHYFRTLAEPLLYRSVAFDGLPSNAQKLRGEMFKSAIAGSHRLASYVQTLRTPYLLTPVNLQEIFPSLTNLRRLSYASPIGAGPSPHLVFPLINPILTRLIWSVSVASPYEFFRFLERQTFLEHLHVIDPELTKLYGPKPMPILSPDALPRLQYLNTYTETTVFILPGRKVPHLALTSLDPAVFSYEPSMLDATQTLSIHIEDLSCFKRFPNAKYLQVIGGTFQETLSRLKRFKWPSVEFISFIFDAEPLGKRGEVRPPEALVDGLRHFPKLATVDVVLEWSRDQFEFFRYDLTADQKDSMQPQQVEREQLSWQDWDMWWQGCRIPPSK
ncbi:hypothetical protein ONZ45_g15611 [Pleurotus djamor]|nr:hypothetical protein ONZ45_g15611 [Pleurotus djamor]